MVGRGGWVGRIERTARAGREKDGAEQGRPENLLSRWRANFGIILAVPLKEESAGAAGAAAGEEAGGTRTRAKS